MWIPLIGLTLLALAAPSGEAAGRRVVTGGTATAARSDLGAPGLKVGGIFLRVTDLRRSLAFYEETLDLRRLFGNDEIAALDGGGVMILLERPQREEQAPNAGLAALTEVVFEVPDVRATHEALLAKGVTFATPLRAVTTDGRRDRLAAAFRDPNGHVLSITGWVPREPQP